MKNLRRWQLNSTKPFSLQLAADARLYQTDYTDDQVWELLLGAVDSPALALQTQYGGRVGLASLVPMWFHDGRSIYQAQTYAKPPVISAFAPGYIQTRAQLTPSLALQAEYWAMGSHAVGARFILANTSTTPETLRLDLFGYVVANHKEQPLAIIALGEGKNALSMGEVGNLKPVVLLENGSTTMVGNQAVSPKIGVDLTIPAKGQVNVRWVHAGLKTLRDSLSLAQNWLKQDWTAHFGQIDQAAQAIPIIETGKSDWDAAVAFSYQLLIQAFMKPTESLPYASFVGTRHTWQGFSPRGDGSDHPRAWSGQSVPLAYLTVPAAASIAPQMAQGVIRNYLSIQADDGWIDNKPGLAGQREGTMCVPVLARMAWNCFQYTEDREFLAEVFPPLLKFFERWFSDDLDTDQDGFPEWQSERETGYVYMPTFAIGQTWGQNANIRLMETPDMAAYLLSEAISLREMARVLGKKRPASQLDKRIAALQNLLDSLWHDGRYAYRDRDTHATTGSVVILDDGRGDEEHLPALPLTPPNRVIVRVSGGTDNVPRGSLHLEGLDTNGRAIAEVVDTKAFIWSYGRGVYTSQRVFAQLDRVRFDGLSRVYRIRVETVDSTRLDINGLLPLWSGGIPKERAQAVVTHLTDSKQFWCPNGVTMCSAQDAAFDPSNANGSGGIWPYWLTLIGEGLIDSGHMEQAADLLKRLLKAQTEVLTHQKKFFEFYHSDEAHGSGERGHLGGIVPLYLMMRVFGVRIVSPGKVWAGGPFVWDKPVKITQNGVTVERSGGGTRIRFPSGYTADLKAGHDWQEVIDPNPVAPAPMASIQTEPPPETKPPRQSSKSVIIKVDLDPDDDQ